MSLNAHQCSYLNKNQIYTNKKFTICLSIMNEFNIEYVKESIKAERPNATNFSMSFSDLSSISNHVRRYSVSFQENGKRKTQDVVYKLFIGDDKGVRMRREGESYNFLRYLGFGAPKVYSFQGNDSLIIEYIEGSKRDGTKFIGLMSSELSKIHAKSITRGRKRLSSLRSVLDDRKNITESIKSYLSILQSKNLIEKNTSSQLHKKLKKLEKELEEQTHTFCFRDYLPSNCFFDEKKNKIVYIDLERASFSVPTDDISCLLLYSPEDADIIIKSYQKNLDENIIKIDDIEKKVDLSIIEKGLEVSGFFANKEDSGYISEKERERIISKYLNLALNRAVKQELIKI